MDDYRNILIKTEGFTDVVMRYTTNDMMEIYSTANRQALARGETLLIGKSYHVDLVAYYNRTQG